MKIIALILFFCVCARAENSLPKNSKNRTKESMAEFLDEFIGLKKYLVSDDEFQDPKNFVEISTHLKKLAKAVKKTSHDETLNQENFKFSREVLEDHVSETERVFRLGNKSYARWMTNSTLGICMSCHTQMPTDSRQFGIFFKANYFTSDFDQAEFMFATKNFEGANAIYQGLVTGFPKNNLSADRLEKSAQREILYLIRIKRDLVAAKSLLNKFRQNKQLPEFLLRNLDSWTEQISLWQEKKLPDLAKASSKEIVGFAEKNLSIDANQSKVEASEPRFISNLVVSGILYEYLQKNPRSPDAPAILYWLAVIDREMTKSIFYNLADLYLKECMLKFPESPMAMKCYKEYEAEMVFGYTGSGGTNIPREILQDLKFLKSYVEAKGKSPLKRSVP